MQRRGYSISKATESILNALLGKQTEEEEKEYIRMKEETGLDKATWLNDRHLLRQELEETPRFNTTKAYRVFRSHTQTRNIRDWKSWLQVAAMFILPLLTGGAIWFLTSQSPGIRLSETKIEPVKPMASIRLGDGSQIHLGKNPETITEKDGTTITHSTGQLIYPKTMENIYDPTVYNELTVPRGGEYMLTLSDGTQVWLNADSKLKFPIHFTGHSREVYLSGEAYFAVSRDTTRPFRVHTSQESVTVLGTEFNVRDYKEEKEVVTTLVKGAVKYQDVILKPGFQATASATDGQIKIEAVNLKEYIGWKDGLYIFNHLTLEEMMQTVERNYDVTVFFTNEDIKQLRFSGDLKKYEQVETFLNFIELGGDVTFTVKGKTITVSKKIK